MVTAIGTDARPAAGPTDSAAVPSGCGDTGRGSRPGPGGHRHRRPDQRARRCSRRSAGAGAGCARSTPRRRPRSASTPRRASTTASAARQSGDAITFVRAMDHLDFVDAVRFLADRAGITLHEDQEAGRDHKRRSELLEAMERAVAVVPRAPAALARRRPGARLPALARLRRRRRAPVPPGLGARRLGRAGQGAQAARARSCPTRVSASSTGAAGRRTSSGPGSCSRSATPPGARSRSAGASCRRAPGRHHRSGRAEVQELAGVADLLEAPHALRAQLGQAGRHRPGRGRRLRGLHRRHRVLPGRRAVGGGHVRHRAGRGALHAAAQLRQADRAGLRRRRGRAERDLARLRVGAQARGRRGRGRPPRRQRPRRAGPHRPRGAGPRHQGGPALPAVPGRPHAGRRATSRRPRGGPGRPRRR